MISFKKIFLFIGQGVISHTFNLSTWDRSRMPAHDLYRELQANQGYTGRPCLKFHTHTYKCVCIGIYLFLLCVHMHDAVQCRCCLSFTMCIAGIHLRLPGSKHSYPLSHLTDRYPAFLCLVLSSHVSLSDTGWSLML